MQVNITPLHSNANFTWASKYSYKQILISYIFWDTTRCNMLKGTLLHAGFLLGLRFNPEGGGDMISPERHLTFNGLQGVISQKTELSITNVVRTSDPTNITTASNSSIVACVSSAMVAFFLQWECVYRPFHSNGGPFWLHYSGFSKVTSCERPFC
jgi:hypothetical protein